MSPLHVDVSSKYLSFIKLITWATAATHSGKMTPGTKPLNNLSKPTTIY